MIIAIGVARPAPGRREELLQACADYPGANNARRITFEYVMLKDKNDSDEDARELVRLIRKYKLPAKVNLIPFNPWPGAPYECSTPERIRVGVERLSRAFQRYDTSSLEEER